jgi:Fur family transcriptional regulator, ferric uptake regulator
MIRTKQGTHKERTALEDMALRRAQGLLRARGKRITQQRALLLQIIQESEEHLDAEELYRRAKRRDPHINLATVYRTRNLLKESGLVQPTYLAHAHQREQFESSPAVEHYHFACLRCAKMIEFESPRVDQICGEVKHEFGVEVIRGWLWLEGYCADCKGKRK